MKAILITKQGFRHEIPLDKFRPNIKYPIWEALEVVAEFNPDMQPKMPKTADFYLQDYFEGEYAIYKEL